MNKKAGELERLMTAEFINEKGELTERAMVLLVAMAIGMTKHCIEKVAEIMAAGEIKK